VSAFSGSGATPSHDVHAAGLTAAERNALDITQVQVLGATEAGFEVTVRLVGDFQRLAGRGHMTLSALAVRFLDSRGHSLQTVVSYGPSPGLAVASSPKTTPAVIRQGNTVTVVADAAQLQHVRKVEALTFARVRTGRRHAGRAYAAQEVGLQVTVNPSNLGPPADVAALQSEIYNATTCLELDALLRDTVRWIARLKPTLDDLYRRRELARRKFALLNHELGQVNKELFAGGTIEKQRHLALIERRKQLIVERNLADQELGVVLRQTENAAHSMRVLINLRTVIFVRLDAFCGQPPVPKLKAIHAVFDEPRRSTTYTEDARSGWTLDSLFQTYLAPKGFARDSAIGAHNPESGETAYWSQVDMVWKDSATLKPLSASLILNYAWAVAIPADPGCASGFQPNKPEPNQATWFHADASEGGPCNHLGTVYDANGRGHPGTVVVQVSDVQWDCTLTYYGTQGNGVPVGDGPPPTTETCRRHGIAADR
jgi:hypothetical protein